MNATHDPQRRSWVVSANRPGGAFPIQNLPLGVFEAAKGPAIGIAIGDQVLGLRNCAGLLGGLPAGTVEACDATTLNPLMAGGPESWSALRARLSDLLRADHPRVADHQRALAPHLLPMAEVTMLKPAVIGGFTDFYASMDHATRVGRLFRPENPLLPNYKYVPIGYHGRASSIVVSGTPIRRPSGQSRPAVPGGEPGFGPSKSLDYELEVGMYIAEGNPLGEPIAVREAGRRIFGISLLNDWSARDIQSWEYQPLGPFLGKSFATSVSAWGAPMGRREQDRAPGGGVAGVAGGGAGGGRGPLRAVGGMGMGKVRGPGSMCGWRFGFPRNGC